MKRPLLLALIALATGFSACCFGGRTAPIAAPPVAAAPAAAPVLDGDKDGVSDAKDRCPDSPAGSAVNAFGCPKGEKVTVALNVEFETDKTEVRAAYDDQLKKVADFLKTYPDAKAEIEGHTDNVGSAESNKALSQKRADAVRQALIDRFGADAGRLTAHGYGEEKPLADNGAADGRARNRRVAATFTVEKE